MRLFESIYRLKINDDIGDPNVLGVRFESVDGRLASLEAVEADWQQQATDLANLGLQRINDLLQPAVQTLLGEIDIGAYFLATSATEATVGLGPLILFVREEDRSGYAPPAYVAIMPDDGSTSPTMMGRVTSYDRPSGQVDVVVDQVGGGGTRSGWIISPAAPIDNAAIGATASGAAANALLYRNDALSYRDDAATRSTDAQAAASDATAARIDALAAEAATVAARDTTLAAVATYNQLWLGAHATDPILDNVGGALVDGASYVNTATVQLRFRVAGDWTTVVVPIGSEVLSAFGRTGAVVGMAGDYDTTKITRTPGGVAGGTAELAIADLLAKINMKFDAGMVSVFAATLLNDPDVAAMWGTLGLGSAAIHAATDFANAVHNHPWTDIVSGKPTTVAGYGIADAYTKAEVDAAIAALVGAAPGALNTLNELANALNNDPSFSTTILGLVGAKLNVSSVSSFMLGVLSGSTDASVRATLNAANVIHGHAIMDIVGLQTALDAKQATAVSLAAIAALTPAADRLAYFTGASAAAVTPITTQGRSLIDDIDAPAMRTTLGLRIGTDVQAQDAGLQSFAGLGSGADKIAFTTGVDAWAESPFPAFGRSLAAAVDAAAANALLGGAFPAGTQIVFGTAPPAGWTARGDLNDRGLRINSVPGAAGGVIGFTTVFSRTATDNTALSVAMLPAHSHEAGTLKANTRHAVNYTPNAVGGGNTLMDTTANTVALAIDVSGNTANTGSGAAHSHGMDIRLAYFDVAIGVKS